MYKTYLNNKGELVTKTFKDLKTTWTKINEYSVPYMNKEEKLFLEKYGLKPTIFNVSNLRILKHIYLTPHFVNVVLSNGAIDKRKGKPQLYEFTIRVEKQITTTDRKTAWNIATKNAIRINGNVHSVSFIKEVNK